MNILRSLYLLPRLFIIIGATIFLFVLSHFMPIFFAAAKICFFTLILLMLLDFLLLYRMGEGIRAKRQTPEKLSNGDANPIKILIENFYRFPVKIRIIDELPFQLQVRDFILRTNLKSGSKKLLKYNIRPLQRGEYHFGSLNIYPASPIGLISRKFKFDQNVMVPAYPSFIQMRKYELFTISNRLTEAGIKKIRKIGHMLEFDQIRKYISGDDYRTINWKATARKADLMVNQYQDEKSQQVYCVIDMGRVMKMPFEGMSLLDYAVNAALALSNVSINKQDKAGIITFSNKIETVLAAERKYSQMFKILEVLYNQSTDFLESNYEQLYAVIARKIKQRSMIVIFTNFETLSALRRQLKYLRNIARRHLLVTIFFENTELKQTLSDTALTTEQIYIKTIAEKFAYEKKQIVKELERYGINSILSAPQGLTINAINKYLELKARGLI